MENEIKSIIEKNLPAQVGEALKKELGCLADARETIKQLRGRLDAANEAIGEHVVSINNLNTAVSELEAKLVHFTDIEVREQTLIIAEKTLETELRCADARINDVKEIVGSVFNNNVIRRSVCGHRNLDGYTDSHGNWVQNRVESINETTTTEEGPA